MYVITFVLTLCDMCYDSGLSVFVCVASLCVFWCNHCNEWSGGWIGGKVNVMNQFDSVESGRVSVHLIDMDVRLDFL